MKNDFFRAALKAVLVAGLLACFFGPTTVLADPINDVEAAFRAHRQKDFDTALKIYTKILADRNMNNRERAVTYLLRGEVYRDKGDPDRAIADFDRAIRIKSNYSRAFYYRGLTWDKKGQTQKAFKDVEQAAMLDPENKIYTHRLDILKAKLAAQAGSASPGKESSPSLVFGPETEKTP